MKWRGEEFGLKETNLDFCIIKWKKKSVNIEFSYGEVCL